MASLLALDTSTRACSVAVMRDGEALSHCFEAMDRGQAERLLPMVDEVMGAASMDFPALDAVLVTRGPGAFTGLRIGLAAARGLALAADIPCFGLTTLEVLARQTGPGGEPLLVAIDSKRGDLFVQAFDPDGTALMKPEGLAPDRLSPELTKLGLAGPLRLAGDAAEKAALNLAGFNCTMTGISHPDALALGELACSLYPLSAEEHPPSPLYLRPPDAKVPKDGGRLRPRALVPASSRPDRTG
ncbi:MAG: tRNA (adenosine(37)-N6)-threonylcarbamoyltransferase complex dimerization subunit type 1 TsaB [Magnetovibrionaceae bacterium]